VLSTSPFLLDQFLQLRKKEDERRKDGRREEEKKRRREEEKKETRRMEVQNLPIEKVKKVLEVKGSFGEPSR